MTEKLILTIAVLGGTGKEGSGLAYRWAQAGYNLIIGSRTPEKAERVAGELNAELGEELIRGLGNEEAAKLCDIGVLTVPFKAHRATLEALKPYLQGKILVDVTVPLVPPSVDTVQIPEGGSAAKNAQELLGEAVSVVSAFQNISHEHLHGDHPIPCDVLVCGNNPEAREQVLQLVDAAGLQGWNAGPIANSIVAEGLTSILISINKQYKVKGAGIQITGVPRENAD
ncbi:MAG: NADPH-dependent F420 reductase [Anaerolineales bacterium]|nr:NADPH-dependent F420 reductase [Anaerolineales bacterium]